MAKFQNTAPYHGKAGKKHARHDAIYNSQQEAINALKSELAFLRPNQRQRYFAIGKLENDQWRLRVAYQKIAI